MMNQSECFSEVTWLCTLDERLLTKYFQWLHDPVRGLMAGNAGQLAASLIGIVANILWVVPSSAFALWCIGKIVGTRVPMNDEIAGLDVPELGMAGYVNDAIFANRTRNGGASQ